MIFTSNKTLSVNSIDTKIITNASGITVTSPVFSINNGINLTPTSVNITGNINFTNPNAILSNTNGLIIEASQIKNTADIITIDTPQTNITGNVNIIGRLNSLMYGMPANFTRNVRTSLFKFYGNNNYTSTLSTVPVFISTANSQSMGANSAYADYLRSGDKLCFTLTGLLTTATTGNLNIIVKAGGFNNLVQACSFTISNVVMNADIVKIIIDCDVIKNVATGLVTLDTSAFCTVIRNNLVTHIVSTTGNIIGLSVNYYLEIWAYHSVAQASSFKLIGYSIEQY